MDKPEIPQELQQELTRALQNIAFFFHEAVRRRQIMVDIKFVSDAVEQNSQALITVAGLGGRISKVGEEGGPDAGMVEEPSAMVDEVISKSIQQAREMGHGTSQVD